jgi:hypothetical protein
VLLLRYFFGMSQCPVGRDLPSAWAVALRAMVVMVCRPEILSLTRGVPGQDLVVLAATNTSSCRNSTGRRQIGALSLADRFIGSTTALSQQGEAAAQRADS